MNVEIINPEVVENLYKNHGQFAAVCYNTPEKYAERVGQRCQDNGHFSGSRCEYIKFRVTGVDRGTAEQCLRHEIGTDVPFEYQDNYSFSDHMERVLDIPADHIVKNMASFRYIDKDGFKYETPALILKHREVESYYSAIMSCLNDNRNELKRMLIDIYEEDPKEVNEAINFVLPRATTTDFVIGFTPEAFIQFCHKRLCTRAQEFINELAHLMVAEVSKCNSRFSAECVPQCVHLMWCPEGKDCCGRAPTKAQLKEKLENGMW